MKKKLISYIILSSFLSSIYAIGKNETSSLINASTTTSSATSTISIVTTTIGFDIITLVSLIGFILVSRLRSKGKE